MTFNWKDIWFRVVLIAAAIYAIALGAVCWCKYAAFAYRDWDLAVYSLFCRNVMRGDVFSTLLGAPFLGNHLNFLMFLVAPLYSVFDSPLFLLLLQTAFLGFAAVPLYAVAAKELGGKAAAGAVLLYLLHPGVSYTNLNEFHPESFFPLLFFAAFHGLTSGRSWQFVVFSILSLLLKENLALPVALLGLYAALAMRRRAGWGMFGAGMAWFVIGFMFIIPALNKGVVGYFNIYPQFGNKPAEIVLNMLTHPMEVLKTACSVGKLTYALYLLLPLCFLPLLDLKTALIAAPLLLQHLLSSRPNDYDIRYYYSVEILPPLFLAAILGLKRLSSWCASPRFRLVPPLVCAAGVAAGLLIGPWRPQNWPALKRDIVPSRMSAEKARMVRTVESGVPTVATFQFLPHLADRDKLYSLHYPYTGFSILSRVPYTLPDNVDCALVDFNDMFAFKWFYRPDGHNRLQELLNGRGFRVVDFAESLVLFKRQDAAGQELYSRVSAEETAAMQYETHMVVDDAIELEGYDVEIKADCLEFVFYWQALKQTGKDITLRMDFSNEAGGFEDTRYHPLCYRLDPTTAWTPGDRFRERVRFLMPEALPGGCDMRISFLDHITGQVVPITSAAQTDTSGRAILPSRVGSR